MRLIICCNMTWVVCLGCGCLLAIADDAAPTDRELRHRIRQVEADEKPIRGTESLESERKILASLRQPIRANWVNQPLDQILVQMRKATGIEFVVDRAAFAEDGDDANPAITFDVGEVTALYALDHLGPRWSLEEGGDVVLRPAKSNEVYFTRVYDISKLTHWLAQNGIDQLTEPETRWWEILETEGELPTRPRPRGRLLRRSGGNTQLAQQRIADLVLWTSNGQWMVRDQEGGSIQHASGRLFVRQTFTAHLSVAGTLDALEQLTTDDGTLQPVSFRAWDAPLVEEASLEAALNTRISVRFEKSTLEDVLKELGKTPGFRYYFNRKEIENELEAIPLVTLELTDVKLRTALKLILQPAGLTLFPDDGVLLIYPLGLGCAGRLQTLAYRVDQIPLALDRQAFAQLIQEQTTGKWMELDQEGGRLVWICPKILIVSAEPRVQKEVERLLRALEKPPTANGVALVKPADPVPFFEIRLYRLASEDEAKEIRRALSLVINDPSHLRTVKKVGRHLVIEASPSGHTQIDTFLQSLHDGPAGPAANKAGTGLFNVPFDAPR